LGATDGLIQCFRHRHGGAALEDFGKQADVTGIKMRHQHEGHAGLRRAGAKEGFKGFQPAGGSANADNGKGRYCVFLVVSHELGRVGGGHHCYGNGASASKFPQTLATTPG
jgi:hypothetical protein